MLKYRADAMFYGGLLVEKPGAAVVLSNELGCVVTYRGRPPTFLEPPAASVRLERCAYCGTRAAGRHCDSCGAPT